MTIVKDLYFTQHDLKATNTKEISSSTFHFTHLPKTINVSTGGNTNVQLSLNGKQDRDLILSFIRTSETFAPVREFAGTDDILDLLSEFADSWSMYLDKIKSYGGRGTEFTQVVAKRFKQKQKEPEIDLRLSGFPDANIEGLYSCNGLLYSIATTNPTEYVCTYYGICGPDVWFKFDLSIYAGNFIKLIVGSAFLLEDEHGLIHRLDSNDDAIMVGTLYYKTMRGYVMLNGVRLYYTHDQYDSFGNLSDNNVSIDVSGDVTLTSSAFSNIREKSYCTPWRNYVDDGDVKSMTGKITTPHTMISHAGASIPANYFYLPNSNLTGTKINVTVSNAIEYPHGSYEEFMFSWNNTTKYKLSKDGDDVLYFDAGPSLCMNSNYEYINGRYLRPIMANYLSVKSSEDGKDVVHSFRAYILKIVLSIFDMGEFFIGGFMNGCKVFIYSTNTAKLQALYCIIHHSKYSVDGKIPIEVFATTKSQSIRANAIFGFGAAVKEHKFRGTVPLTSTNVRATIESMYDQKRRFLNEHLTDPHRKNFYNFGLSTMKNLGTDLLQLPRCVKFIPSTESDVNVIRNVMSSSHQNPFVFDEDEAVKFFGSNQALVSGGKEFSETHPLATMYCELMGRTCYVGVKPPGSGSSLRITDQGDFAGHEIYPPRLPELVVAYAKRNVLSIIKDGRKLYFSLNTPNLKNPSTESISGHMAISVDAGMYAIITPLPTIDLKPIVIRYEADGANVPKQLRQRANNMSVGYLYYGNEITPFSMSSVAITMLDFTHLLRHCIEMNPTILNGDYYGNYSMDLRPVDISAIANHLSRYERYSIEDNKTNIVPHDAKLDSIITKAYPAKFTLSDVNYDDAAGALVALLANLKIVVDVNDKLPDNSNPMDYATLIYIRMSALNEIVENHKSA